MRTDIRPEKGQLKGQLFESPTVDIAKRLIGAVLVRRIPKGEPDAGTLLVGRIVETEAYLPLVDPACHGYRGPTQRTAVLFGRPGFAYVYLIYGMHYCFNVTTEPAGIGAAVLVRALEPVAGIDAMRRRRGKSVPTAALASGPGNLCKALSIDLRCNGADLRSGDLTVSEASPNSSLVRAVSARIGLTSASDWQLRFFDAASPSVSPFRNGRMRTQEAHAKSR